MNYKINFIFVLTWISINFIQNVTAEEFSTFNGTVH